MGHNAEKAEAFGDAFAADVAVVVRKLRELKERVAKYHVVMRGPELTLVNDALESAERMQVALDTGLHGTGHESPAAHEPPHTAPKKR
jgi:hypothetical protein